MPKTLSIVLVVLLLLVAGWYVYSHQKPAVEQQAVVDNLGSYSYECDEHVAFTMTPALDMSTIHIKADSGAYPPESTLTPVSSTVGTRYEGNGVVFVGRGETVTLGEGDSAINCSPIPKPDEAPFNWGDGGVSMDSSR